MHRSTEITRDLRARAIKALGGMCKYCAHSEPLALCIRSENPTAMRLYKPYQHYRVVLKPGGAKYCGYYLICRNCLASHSNTSTSLSI